MAREDFTPKVKREIINYSAGSCMICRKNINSPKIAHIIPAAVNGPRSEYREKYGLDFIKSPDNGMCLCQTCHDLIDDDGLNSYSLDELFKINQKFKTEFHIKEEYKTLLGIDNVNHSNELEKFYQHLLTLLDATNENSTEFSSMDSSFTKIPIDEKIESNGLFLRQARLIRSNYAFDFLVFKNTMENYTIISEKIKTAIKILFERVKETENTKSNAEIFDKMLTLMHDPSRQIVGNQIPLIYFFIICEVFSI
ncbi:HNH endonuclease signature motif containing protein [Carnobacterium maltaromaticum]|uniref:HNH endonuclease signature motif containing protein n=1 Tax=Carnobacterium maltaromaticum TaxID=2751 RepID=UPI00295F0C33|nr:HNH endonuclease signature motif containing protein [Carnobacterium maltaromaticum]